jgi:hypothetical protein
MGRPGEGFERRAFRLQDIGHRTEIGDVDAAEAQRFRGRRVIGADDDFDRHV